MARRRPSPTAADGSEHLARFRSVAVDPLDQTYTREVRLEKWREGSLIASEEYLLRGNMYLKSEVVLMLRVAGFSSISVPGDYTDEPGHRRSRKAGLRRNPIARAVCAWPGLRSAGHRIRS